MNAVVDDRPTTIIGGHVAIHIKCRIANKWSIKVNCVGTVAGGVTGRQYLIAVGKITISAVRIGVRVVVVAIISTARNI